MYDEATFTKEINNDLKLDGLIEILQSILDFEKTYDARINHFAITGGDPLLYPKWYEFIKELKQHGKVVTMMGNPETLTEKNLIKLKELDISNYQLSIDGLEKTHDHIRGKGSFNRTVNGIEKLLKYNINTHIMFTLNKYNKNELIPLIQFLAKNTNIHRFCFDIMSGVGNGAEMEMDLTAAEILDIFKSYLKEKNRLKNEGHPIYLKEKSHLFKVLRILSGDKKFYEVDNISTMGGCLIGWTCFCILPDGRVLACRRFPLEVGKLPEQSFSEIFLGSETLKKFRRPSFYKGCGFCKFYTICRGCPAVVFGLTGDPFAVNPLCFKGLLESELKINDKQDKEVKFKELPLNTSYKEEYDLIASNFNNSLPEIMRKSLNSPEACKTVLLLSNKDNLKAYERSSSEFFSNFNINLLPVDEIFIEEFTKIKDITIREKIHQICFWNIIKMT